MNILEQDPLSQDRKSNQRSSSEQQINCKGRPAVSKIIKFCPQPKSIVAQLINKMKSEQKVSYQPLKLTIQCCQSQNLTETGLSKVTLDGKSDMILDNRSHLKTVYVIEDNESEDNKGKTKKKSRQRKISNLKNEMICEVASQRLNDQSEVEEHMSSSHKEHITKSCDFPSCTYSSKIMSNLLKHKRIHTNEKPYLCDQCTFRSNFVNSLKVHKRIHTSERPYCCDKCGHRCNSISNLKKHVLQKHIRVK